MSAAHARRIAAACASAAYLAFLVSRSAFAVGGSDSSGYVNAARGFFSGHIAEPVVELGRLGLGSRFLAAFIPLGYVPGARPGTMVPLYPPGLPLHMAAAFVFGRNGPHFVAPAAALACVILIAVLARDVGLAPPAAFAGAAILAAQPLLLFVALQPLSDVPATAWSLAAVVAARRSRTRPRAAVVAGLAGGIAALIRPAGILIALPAAVYLGADRGRLRLAAAGAAIPALFLLGYDRIAFGHVLSSGYLETGHASALAWNNFPERSRYYAHWLSATLTGLVLGGWLVSLGDRRIPRRDRLALAVWPVSFYLFYSFYAPYRPWTFVRFLLPAMPALILGFLLAGRGIRERLAPAAGPRSGAAPAVGALAAAAVAVVIALEIRQVRRLGVLPIVADERIYPRACSVAAAVFPPNALVLSMAASGALRYYTKLPVARTDVLSPEDARIVREALDRRGRPLAAVLFPGEDAECFRRYPGPWRRAATVGNVTLWSLP